MSPQIASSPVASVSDPCSRFRFHTLPFTREILVANRFAHPTFDEAHKALLQAITHGMSAALIAPAGTGKTALLRWLDDHLPAARYRTHYIKLTHLSKRDLCREVALAVGAQAAGSFPMLVRRLQEHLAATSDTEGQRPVLFVDDAHEMRREVMGILSVLTNFDMDSRLVVSVVLCGQGPLAQLIRHTEDVQGRLAHIAQLSVLSRTDTTRYIEHRCRVAGATQVPFDTDALDAAFEISRGNLRAIDRLCRKALLIAHDRDHDCVDANHIAEARRVLWP